MILRIILFNELKDFLPQGGVRRRPKKVPLSFSALARGALQAPGCAEDRHSPPAGPPEGRRRQWCAKKWCQQVPTLRRRISQPFYQKVESRKILWKNVESCNRPKFSLGIPRNDRIYPYKKPEWDFTWNLRISTKYLGKTRKYEIP